MSLAVGQQAPDFTLKSSDMEDVTLSTHKGNKNVVLLFVPFAFTGVCTEELCNTSGDLGEYGELNAEVLGISGDSPFSLKSWKEKEDMSVTLLSDYNHDVAGAFGVAYDELLGMKGVAKRSVFVIDKAGTIQHTEVMATPKEMPDLNKVKEVLQGL